MVNSGVLQHRPGRTNTAMALPDGARVHGPFRRFETDPMFGEAWWWLGIPALLAIGLIAVNAFAREFFMAWILPEGYGFLELGHFLMSTAGFVIAVWLLFRPVVRQRKLVFYFVCMSALACFYIAGEEQSWGQHFFHWQTPEYWSSLNRQQETNLHNTLHLFDKKPRVLLEFGVLIGGIIIPTAAMFSPRVRRNRWSLFLPASAMMPVALGAWTFKLSDKLMNEFHIAPLVRRPSETTEFFLYLFILYYLIIFVRRIGELEREDRVEPQ